MSEFNSRAFRDALGSFATGVTVVTAQGADGALAGLTVNSFASVSLDPPLILWSLSLYSPSLPIFQNCSHYAINVLAQEQVELSNHFAATQTDRFAALEFNRGAAGAPLLPGCCAWFECKNEMRHAGGDHLIFVGLVESYRQELRPPLLFQGGRYRSLAET